MTPTGDDRASGARQTVADIADDVRSVTQPLLDDAVSDVSFLLLAVLLVPVGIVVLIGSFVVFGIVAMTLHPTGILATAVTVAWLVGTLAALFFAFRVLYRRVPRRLRAGYANAIDRPAASRAAQLTVEPPRLHAQPGPIELSPTLAELDARLEPRPLPRHQS
jgi:hypothetical protein